MVYRLSATRSAIADSVFFSIRQRSQFQLHTVFSICFYLLCHFRFHSSFSFYFCTTTTKPNHYIMHPYWTFDAVEIQQPRWTLYLRTPEVEEHCIFVLLKIAMFNVMLCSNGAYLLQCLEKNSIQFKNIYLLYL